MILVYLGYLIGLSALVYGGLTDTGYAGDAWWADVVAFTSATAMVLFVYGWNWKQQAALSWGFLITSGTLMARAVFTYLIPGGGSGIAATLSLGSAVVAGGLFWHSRGRERQEGRGDR